MCCFASYAKHLAAGAVISAASLVLTIQLVQLSPRCLGSNAWRTTMHGASAACHTYHRDSLVCHSVLHVYRLSCTHSGCALCGLCFTIIVALPVILHILLAGRMQECGVAVVCRLWYI